MALTYTQNNPDAVWEAVRRGVCEVEWGGQMPPRELIDALMADPEKGGSLTRDTTMGDEGDHALSMDSLDIVEVLMAIEGYFMDTDGTEVATVEDELGQLNNLGELSDYYLSLLPPG